MQQREGPRCPLAGWVPLCLMLLALAGGQGAPGCREEAVAADGELLLLLEEPSQGWQYVEWRVTLDTGSNNVVLSAERNKPPVSRGSFSGRAVLQGETPSLRVSPVSPADSGVYKAEFEDTSGVLTAPCFRVSVWDPVRQPRLEARILHREQGRCNLSLLCAVPAAGNVSYSWSCAGDILGALGHHPQLHLQVRGDTDPAVCSCNASNPVSWSTASTDVAAACPAPALGLSSILLWSALGLALAVSVALAATCCWWRKRGMDPPAGQAEQSLTVYEEVGKPRTSQDPNGTSEATTTGNTIYAVISTKTQRPRCPQEPQSCTIYSTIQPTKRSPSVRRKRLDPALMSTAYVEVTEGSRPWGPQLQTSPPAPASHNLS
ncbi:natural killer cell receptor 2B4-like [Podargus strigoides]